VESKNRNRWIIVAVVLVLACCCALAAGAMGVTLLSRSSFDLGGFYRERMEQSFEVGDAPHLDISNFAGTVKVKAGVGNTVHVVAVKKASSRARLDRIEVNVSERTDGVVVTTRMSPSTGNASVELEITAPAGSRLDVDTGAGTIDVRGITGPMDVHNGAGTINVRGAQGMVRLGVGAGTINYEGTLAGDCSFNAGAGTIVLKVPRDTNVEVDVGAAMGTVSVGFDVDGQSSPREVRGVIGNGSQGSVEAHTGVGTIILSHE
jgi:hypothetical protein